MYCDPLKAQNSSKNLGLLMYLLPHLLLIFLLLPAIVLADVVPAFQGAQGAGAVSRGGRGGVVIEVTNLNDSGDGSLRSAINASGPRIVVFRVGGIINTETTLQMKNPYITIAGQTAPGGGILINGKNVAGATIAINSHDVILRFLRVRNGSGGGTDEDDTIGVYGGYNIIVDHCSVSWSTDENISTWAWDSAQWGAPKNVTWSHNLLAEGLLEHSKGMLSGASSSAEADEMLDIDIHHNLFMHHYDRTPFVKHKSGRVVNNISYNWSGFGLSTYGGVHLDIIRNLYKPGPDYQQENAEAIIGSSPVPDAATFNPKDCPALCPYLFVEGNKGPRHQNPDRDNWRFMSDDWGSRSIASAQYQRHTQLPEQDFPITALHVSKLENQLLPSVGASHRLTDLGVLVPNRDAVDTRLIDEYMNGTGSVITYESTVGGLPRIAAGNAYLDGDKDGMADRWEVSVGLDPSDSKDGNLDMDDDGISNIEDFLNGRTPNLFTQPIVKSGSFDFLALLILSILVPGMRITARFG